MAAASAAGKANCLDSVSVIGGPKCGEDPSPLCREMIKPSVVELSKEVRTNILCTVEGCGKILPNTPALNMHLVKSHRVKDGLINPTVRKDMKGSQKLYCCPIEGCPRGPNRPFSQFSLVKQHFMKMHAERKHKCSKCNNGYSTEWDLRRHEEDCGKTYRCTCGCPYASRAALLSHVYRTGHEVPTEHRIPPVKKRKIERLLSGGAVKVKPESTYQIRSGGRELSEGYLFSDAQGHASDSLGQTFNPPRSLHKLLLPKPKMALVNVPVMQLAHLPVLLPSTESGALRSVVLAVDSQGSLSTLHLLPQAMAAMVPQLDAKTLGFKDGMPASRSSSSCLGPISTGVQVSLEPVDEQCLGGQRGRSTSTNIQTDISCLSRVPMGTGVGMGLCSLAEASVSSSCAQTDISVSAQVLLPVSVETQTFPPRPRNTSTIGAQTDGLRLGPQTPLSCPSPFPYATRQTQTACPPSESEQAIMCSALFDGDALTVSTQTALADALRHPLAASGDDDDGGLYGDEKSTSGGLCFGAQTDGELNANGVADNQTQTMALFNDLENILSDASAGCGSVGLGGGQEAHSGIDFDFEAFLNAVHIQTQTEESELGGLDTPLESLDTQTQTDFLLPYDMEHGGGGGGTPSRTQASDLELEMFDTQTQTDLNFLLSAGGHMPLGHILRQSSFSMSTESSDTETQTDVPPAMPHPALSSDPTRPLSSAETQTAAASQAEGLGHLFLTSNETQTAMDDFLSADLAWNMESHFSSVETQTCEELCALFQHPPEKPNS